MLSEFMKEEIKGTDCELDEWRVGISREKIFGSSGRGSGGFTFGFFFFGY